MTGLEIGFCHIIFEKAKGSGRAVNRATTMRKQPSGGFFKKGVMINFAEFTKNIRDGIPFLGAFLSNLQNLYSDYNRINISEGSVGKQNCKL